MPISATCTLTKRRVGLVTVLENSVLLLVAVVAWFRLYWKTTYAVGYIDTNCCALKYETHLKIYLYEDIYFEFKYKGSLIIIFGLRTKLKLNIKFLLNNNLNVAYLLVVPFDLRLLPSKLFFIELWRDSYFQINISRGAF